MMEQKASVSVVIPCYNAEKTIGRALDSILAQSQLPYEIIIVDDKSTDGSCSIVKDYTKRYEEKLKITLIELEYNSGPAKARNIGWDNAISDYIAFLDSDDSWHPQKIELQYNYMQGHPDITLSGHLYEVVNNQPDIHDEKIEKIEEITKIKLLIKNRFSTPTVMLKRDINIKFKEFKKYSEDYLLWLEILLNSNRCILLHNSLCYLYKPTYGVSGLSKNIVEMWKGGLKNYQVLYNEGHIGLFLYQLLVLYRTLKFFRMFIVSKYKTFFLRKKY